MLKPICNPKYLRNKKRRLNNGSPRWANVEELMWLDLVGETAQLSDHSRDEGEVAKRSQRSSIQRDSNHNAPRIAKYNAPRMPKGSQRPPDLAPIVFSLPPIDYLEPTAGMSPTQRQTFYDEQNQAYKPDLNEDYFDLENYIVRDHVTPEKLSWRRGFLPEKSALEYCRHYNDFLDWLNSHRIKIVDAKTVMCYGDWMLQEEKKARSTCNKEVSAIKRTLLPAMDVDLINSGVLKQYQKTLMKRHIPKKSSFVSDAEYNRFIALSNDHNIHLKSLQALSLFGRFGGLRGGEYESVYHNKRVRDDGVSTIEVIATKDGKMIKVVHFKEKSNKWQTFFICGKRNVEICLDYFAETAAMHKWTGRLAWQYRLTKKKGSKDAKEYKWYNQHRGKNWFYSKMWREIGRMLGLKEWSKMTGHGGRRGGASKLANGGCSVLTLKSYGCWNSAKIAESYVSKSDKIRMDIAKQLMNDSDNSDGESKESESKEIELKEIELKGITHDANDLEEFGPPPNTNNSNNVSELMRDRIKKMEERNRELQRRLIALENEKRSNLVKGNEERGKKRWQASVDDGQRAQKRKNRKRKSRFTIRLYLESSDDELDELKALNE
eukprot:85534_1